MITLNEWNRVLLYAKLLETDRIKTKTYTMYNNTKGIYLNIYDNDGNLFTQYSSGIHNNFEDYKRSLDYYYNRCKEIIGG